MCPARCRCDPWSVHEARTRHQQQRVPSRAEALGDLGQGVYEALTSLVTACLFGLAQRFGHLWITAGVGNDSFNRVGFNECRQCTVIDSLGFLWLVLSLGTAVYSCLKSDQQRTASSLPTALLCLDEAECSLGLYF